ncbi:hypothetical protein EVAR_5992_1 [Eumeta japonica]|uniref:Uncharacterized protein n=1 Tax=Eumeta variegata TaxID=151549 RepID=A0A4C1TCM6_EUMVA|nr:hypothetical protein EVAR_5992_1 [Eumeta japonica]
MKRFIDLRESVAKRACGAREVVSGVPHEYLILMERCTDGRTNHDPNRDALNLNIYKLRARRGRAQTVPILAPREITGKINHRVAYFQVEERWMRHKPNAWAHVPLYRLFRAFARTLGSGGTRQ